MHIIIDEISHRLVKTEETANFVEYAIYRSGVLLGYISKTGIEIHYTARDTEGNIKSTAATLRDTLEGMILNIFYSHTFKGDRYINTLGAWIEGAEVKIEYDKNNIVKHSKRVIRYDKAAGDLYITLDNNKYFYHEFN